MKYIDAALLRKEIEFAKSVYGNPKRVVHGVADAYLQDGRAAMCDDILKKIDSLQQEQPEQDITEFEKALDEFGEAYATLVDRDNNPNQGIRVNAYHELVQENISRILELAKEYAKQKQPQVADASKMEREVDLEKEIKNYFKGFYMDLTDQGYILKNSDGPIGLMSVKDIARHFYELGLNARKEDNR